jgi:hypothetical protein
MYTMKNIILTVASAAFITLGANVQAADSPAMLRGIAQKQVLTTGQLAQVRGEGLGPIVAKVKVDVAVDATATVAATIGTVHATVGTVKEVVGAVKTVVVKTVDCTVAAVPKVVVAADVAANVSVGGKVKVKI